jgi:hypothetical protein
VRLRPVALATLALLLTLMSVAGAQLRPQALVLQNAVASATANGTVAPTLGYDAIGVQVVIASAWDGTINLETTTDGATWVAVMCRNSATNATQTTVAAANAFVVCPVTGTQEFRARISGRTTGTVTVTAALAGINAGIMGGLGSGTVQDENLKQINGTTVSQGNGTTGNGSQRVTIASDQTAYAIIPNAPTGSACKNGTVNAKGTSGGTVTVDATAGGITVADASASRCSLLIQNEPGGGDMRCMTGATAPTSTVGFLVQSGQSLRLDLEGQGAWKCIRTGASSATVSVVEGTT